MAKTNLILHEKYIKWIKIMKYLAASFLGFNILQVVFLFLPESIDLSNDYCMTLCIGKTLNILIQQ